jgi:hypothetical protein
VDGVRDGRLQHFPRDACGLVGQLLENHERLINLLAAHQVDG